MQKALAAGKVRAIGLSNFYDARFVDLAENMDVKPAVVQLEANVFTQQKRMRELMAYYGTYLMAWAPLAEGQHGIFTNSTLTQIGAKYGKTAVNRFLPISTIRLWRSSPWSTTPSSIPSVEAQTKIAARRTRLHPIGLIGCGLCCSLVSYFSGL